ncbi:monocarboxylate transporter 13-like [Anneissia japonica]|uniref:monocarboxylate transporter 13-like n=1 Tax=Anneissia japonica TaxID=1529436 RepID=UPI0014259529|nr:monocarboxylate transporter 13-like [Anneissia japonica]XP_033108296.1 monocarboxylate transporter 13-like [Anneissia japonica]XP_033108297.1 monocarboxylate transporter 13-like [Anneissia japonica]
MTSYFEDSKPHIRMSALQPLIHEDEFRVKMHKVERRPQYLHQPPDGGWGWVVICGSFMCMYISFGIPRTLGIFVTPLVDNFESNTGTIGWIVSMPMTLLLTTGPIAGALCKKYGCRPMGILGGVLAGSGFLIAYSANNVFFLAIGLGILPGMGFGLASTASVVIISRYFENLFVLANGIIYLGGPIGYLSLPPITQLFLQMYEWRGAALILSGVTLHIAVGGALMRPLHLARDLKEINLHEDDENDKSYIHDGQSFNCENKNHKIKKLSKSKRVRSIFRGFVRHLELRLFCENTMFTILLPVILLSGFAYEAWLIYVTPQAEELQISATMSAILLSSTGVGAITGRLSQIAILHWKIMSSYTLLGFGTVVAWLSLMMDPLFQDFVGLLTFSITYGLATGIMMPLGPVLVRDYVGMNKLPAALGWFNLVRGTGALLGGSITGVLHDYYGGYYKPFIVVGMVQFMAVLMLFFKPCIQLCVEGKARWRTEKERELAP